VGTRSNSVTISNTVALPEGTYFILNKKNNLALTPTAPSVMQNIFLKNFNKGGLQKWNLIKLQNGNYHIKLENSDLFFQPHSMQERTAVVSTLKENASFQITAVNGKLTSWQIKSNYFNGDAMRSLVLSPEFIEVRFEPATNTNEFEWEFIRAY
jgi:hypothetical protein